ncbi:MAG: helix-turn-helix domain-containing protein [Bacteroidota bacterium]
MRSDCPLSYALDFFGDKWSLLVIRDMIFEGKRFFNEFRQSKERIATNILSSRLKKLEAIGIVESRVYPQLKTKKEYRLTAKGIDLIPVLVEMIAWSAKYQAGLAVTDDFLVKLNQDREGVLAIIRSNSKERYAVSDSAD